VVIIGCWELFFNSTGGFRNSSKPIDFEFDRTPAACGKIMQTSEHFHKNVREKFNYFSGELDIK
jgi:hypothetical protein